VVEEYDRALALVDTSTLKARESVIDGVKTLLGWSADDQWLLVADASFEASLVNLVADVVPLGARAALSPVAPLIAMSDRGVVLRSLSADDERRLSKSANDSPLFFRADGKRIQYLVDGRLHVISSEDGALLAEGKPWGLFGPGDRLAVADDDGVRVVDLAERAAAIAIESRLPLPLAEGGGAWLKDERFAFADDTGVHLVSPDGAVVDVCPGVTRIAALQVPRSNAY
jgi:hypothetical protein